MTDAAGGPAVRAEHRVVAIVAHLDRIGLEALVACHANVEHHTLGAHRLRQAVGNNENCNENKTYEVTHGVYLLQNQQ